jgi:hypothetical protein
MAFTSVWIDIKWGLRCGCTRFPSKSRRKISWSVGFVYMNSRIVGFIYTNSWSVGFRVVTLVQASATRIPVHDIGATALGGAISGASRPCTLALRFTAITLACNFVKNTLGGSIQ